MAAGIGDEIRLSLPALADHGRIARVMVSRLATRWGFDSRAVEDLRIATDEAVIALLTGDDASRGRGRAPGTLTIRVAGEPDGMAIEVLAPGGARPGRAARRRFGELVGELVDHAEIDDEEAVVRFRRRRSGRTG